ncbi:unnamed protein product [Oikopleura dioica]|uniref:Uncharacterized protein n=1 Tax=Oikopleura dioica TaxID=34765 RepID=E4YL68_OIKDI|nr:unnamed protein product [Oikopleura dioica]
MSNLKQQLTKCVNADMQNLTKNTLDQKWSNLCVPISVTTLLRFAINKDLYFHDKRNHYTFEKILTILTMTVYPRSLAGLNLNPKKEEKDFQTNDIETLLERICKKTYLSESGWEIVRKQGYPEIAESTCEFEKVFLNENFVFTRPLTVTGVILFQNEMNPTFHQMTLDRIENGEYILQNTQFSDEHPAVIRIEQTRPYFHPSYEFVNNLCIQTQNNIYVEGNIKLRFVNQNRLMRYNKWYLLPQAYSLTLTKI